jgi:phage gpG-like protein
MAKVKTVDRDLGYKNIKKQMMLLEKEPYVKIGFPEGGKGWNDKVGAKAKIVEIAIFHEFGTSHGIPERSFIRSTFDEQKEKWFEITGKLQWEIYKSKKTVKEVLKIIGLIIETDQKNKIASGIQPELKYREGTPLWDTGQLINSIQYKVVMHD